MTRHVNRIMNLGSIIKYPLSTEKSIRLMESQNKLIFVVDNNATKQDIKQAMQRMFNVKITKINTYVTNAGIKRAYVQFHPETPALDVATKLGLM